MRMGPMRVALRLSPTLNTLYPLSRILAPPCLRILIHLFPLHRLRLLIPSYRADIVIILINPNKQFLVSIKGHQLTIRIYHLNMLSDLHRLPLLLSAMTSGVVGIWHPCLRVSPLVFLWLVRSIPLCTGKICKLRLLDWRIWGILVIWTRRCSVWVQQSLLLDSLLVSWFSFWSITSFLCMISLLITDLHGIDGRWKNAVNYVNPLGTKGKLTEAFASILHEMWHQETPIITPFTFRVCIFIISFRKHVSSL